MLDLLKEAKVFRECTTEELKEVADITQSLTLKNGERVFDAKNPAEYLYIVAKGAVELRFTVTHYRAAKEVTIDRILEKEAFGWSSLREPHPYTLSALAVKDSKLLRLSAKDVKRLCAENHHLGYVLMKNIADIIGERFDLAQKMLIELIQQELKEKEV